LQHGINSTIVDVTGVMPRILRQGAVAEAAIMRAAQSIRVLFVCTGNTCRSPMAQYYFTKAYDRHREDLSLPVLFDSCGTMAGNGGELSYGARGALEEVGVRDLGHTPKALTSALVKTADLVICMSTWHRESVTRLKPLQGTSIALMSDFADARQYFDVPDPMGGSHDEYMNVMHIIMDAEKAIFEKITAIDIARRKA
jgi:protein-tyrosine-phosphatase